MGIAILSRAHDIDDMQDAVDALTLLDIRQIRRGRAPYWWDAPGIRYRAEDRSGDFANVERFNSAAEIMRMGADDCDGHAPWLAASFIVYGIRARAVVVRSAGVGYHVVVELEGGRIIDPSARRGMLEPEIAGQSRRKRRRRRAAKLRLSAARARQAAERMARGGVRTMTAAQVAQASALLELARRYDRRAEQADELEDDDDDGEG